MTSSKNSPDELRELPWSVLRDEGTRARDRLQPGVGEVVLQPEGEPRGEEGIPVAPGDQDRTVKSGEALRCL